MAVPIQQRQHQQEPLEEANRLYERYGKLLEDEHLGEFVAITRDGRTMLGSDDQDLTRAAKDTFGPGNYISKVGPRVVGRWRFGRCRIGVDEPLQEGRYRLGIRLPR